MRQYQLSNETLERRARRRLAKYGLKVRKHRESGGGYTVYNDPNVDGLYVECGEAHFSDITKLLELTAKLRRAGWAQAYPVPFIPHPWGICKRGGGGR